MPREELVDKLQSGWDTVYNGWLSFLQEQHRPTALVVIGMSALVWWVWLWGRYRLKRALKVHIQLNRKLEELQRDVCKANDRAHNKDRFVETRTLCSEMMANVEKSSQATLQTVLECTKSSNETLQTIVAKALERMNKTQEANNRFLADTRHQFVDLHRSNHKTTTKVVRESTDKSDENQEKDE